MTDTFPTHRVVVCVFRGTQVGPRYLLVRQTAELEGMWRPVLGTVKPEEVIEAAAIREVRAETGIISPKALIDFGFRNREQFGDYDLVEWGVGYDVGDSEPKVTLGRDYRDYRWCDFEEAFRSVELPGWRDAVVKLHLQLFG